MVISKRILKIKLSIKPIILGILSGGQIPIYRFGLYHTYIKKSTMKTSHLPTVTDILADLGVIYAWCAFVF